MIELNQVYDILGKIMPFDCMQMKFMQRALLGLLILAPAAAAMGVQVINFRMSFFADAISHSAFTGIALGIILGLSPYLSTSLFAVIVGLAIIAFLRKSKLTEDAVIGVFFSGVVAFGIAVVSREKNLSRNIQKFLYGDILSIEDSEIIALLILSVFIYTFLFFSYNKLLYIGINHALASAHKIKVDFYQYFFALLLSLIVIFSVWAVGVLLVTAMLIVPAAAARNFAKSAGQMLWFAVLIAIFSSISGIIVSAQSWAGTATGATVVLTAFLFFILSQLFLRLKQN